MKHRGPQRRRIETGPAQPGAARGSQGQSAASGPGSQSDLLLLSSTMTSGKCPFLSALCQCPPFKTRMATVLCGMVRQPISGKGRCQLATLGHFPPVSHTEVAKEAEPLFVCPQPLIWPFLQALSLSGLCKGCLHCVLSPSGETQTQPGEYQDCGSQTVICVGAPTGHSLAVGPGQATLPLGVSVSSSIKWIITPAAQSGHKHHSGKCLAGLCQGRCQVEMAPSTCCKPAGSSRPRPLGSGPGGLSG